MAILKLQQKEISIKTISEDFIEFVKVYGVIKPLQIIYGGSFYDNKLIQMRNLPKNTIGYDMAKMLNDNNLKLIPKFENHDLKHLVLGYDMTTQDEIKMQAYLFGNGNRSISCILFLLSGMLFPNMWSEYYNEYSKGKFSPSILSLSLDDCIHLQSNKIKEQYKTQDNSAVVSVLTDNLKSCQCLH